MSDRPGSAQFRAFFDSALQDYEEKTGISLAKQPLAEKLENCDSVESITAALQDQTRIFSDSQESDRIIKLMESVVSILCKLSATAALDSAIGMAFTPAKAIHVGLAVVLAAAKGVNESYEVLVKLLETIEHFLKHLDINTDMPPTPAMNEIVIKTLVELLSTLALATKELNQGRLNEFVKNHFGEKGVEAVLQRLDRLTHDEARSTATEMLKVVYGLVQNMNGKASADSVRDALENLHQMACDINKSKRDKLQQDIRSRLSPPDPSKNHHIARELLHEATAAWFIQGDAFSEWKSSSPGSLLWIHGKPGAGKSVLCSKIIEDIDAMRKQGLASLAFFYHDFREIQKTDLRGLLSSVLFQLCGQSDSYCDILSDLNLTHRDVAQVVNDELLIRLKNVLDVPGQAPVFLIFDALDECSNAPAISSPRKEVLTLVKELIDTKLPNLRICVISRLETEIKAALEPLAFRSISLHEASGQMQDIENYIRSVVNTSGEMRKWQQEHRELVIDVLARKVDGSFRWAHCQLVYLQGCQPANVQHVLAELPATLDQTYARTLREINNSNWEVAHRLFQLVAAAFRPLRVEELADLLALDFKARPMPTFHEGLRTKDSLDALVSNCSSLLDIVEAGDSSVIQFSHYSVKEYLTSTDLAEEKDEISRRYHISMTSAHTLAAQACLGFLLRLDENITRDSLQRFPLAEYAAEHWFDHTLFKNVSQIVEHGMKQLLNPHRPHLAIWFWIHVARWSWISRRPEKPLRPEGAALLHAAVCSLYGITKVDPREVQSQGFDDRWSAMQLASERGHMEIVRILVAHAVDVKAQDEYGWTALHLASKMGYVETARILIEHSADATAPGWQRWTALHLASERGHLELARILVEHGTGTTAREWHGWTALHVSSVQGHVEVARMLLKHGARVAAQDRQGWTALHLASEAGRGEVAHMLLENGADVMAQNDNGQNALHIALEGGHEEVAHMLVERGADATAHDRRGRTPLHLASAGGRAAFACVLVNHGADVTACDEDGRTPLHLAAAWGRKEVARMIIMLGADMKAQDRDGRTPSRLASDRRHSELARMLSVHCADTTVLERDGQTSLRRASRR